MEFNRIYFSTCIQSNTENILFSLEIKVALVYSVFKTGAPDSIVKYRPISVICNLSKILEVILQVSF